jgi:arabinose-5-phosphate isomerase
VAHLNIYLPDDFAKQLKTEAHREQLSLSAYVAELIQGGREHRPRTRTLAVTSSKPNPSIEEPAVPVAAEAPAVDASEEQIRAILREVIELEASSLDALSKSLDASYVEGVRRILAVTRRGGKVVVTGVGKSGHIARKVAATMSSTGTFALFMHPTEALHGDLGMVSKGDVVLALGKTGESDELNALLLPLRKIGAQVFAITSNRESTLARNADIVFYAPIDKEACPLDLAPTTSSTVALAAGDALAMTLMRLKNFQEEDFALYHPGGRIGRRLLLTVRDLMIARADAPVMHPDRSTIQDVIAALGRYGLGIVLFSRDGRSLDGILTDGDVRRALNKHKEGIFSVSLKELVNPKPISIEAGMRAVEALKVMEDRERPLNVLPVVEGEAIAGVVRLHELLRLA